MIKVVLRDATTGTPRAFGEVPLESVDRVIPILKHWGLDNCGTFVDGDTFMGTFRFDDGGAYFLVEFE